MLLAAGLQEGHWAADCPGQGSGGQYGDQGTGGGYQSASGGYKAPGSYGNPGMSSPPKAGGPPNSGACFKCGQVCHYCALYACIEEQQNELRWTALISLRTAASFIYIPAQGAGMQPTAGTSYSISPSSEKTPEQCLDHRRHGTHVRQMTVNRPPASHNAGGPLEQGLPSKCRRAQ